eukprot:scaffold234133_cov17-Prasinocladus_malaysianus.AAC.1
MLLMMICLFTKLLTYYAKQRPAQKYPTAPMKQATISAAETSSQSLRRSLTIAAKSICIPMAERHWGWPRNCSQPKF